jgi:hypothetical protein
MAGITHAIIYSTIPYDIRYKAKVPPYEWILLRQCHAHHHYSMSQLGQTHVRVRFFNHLRRRLHRIGLSLAFAHHPSNATVEVVRDTQSFRRRVKAVSTNTLMRLISLVERYPLIELEIIP